MNQARLSGFGSSSTTVLHYRWDPELEQRTDGYWEFWLHRFDDERLPRFAGSP
jgi:hypothetical protein